MRFANGLHGSFKAAGGLSRQFGATHTGHLNRALGLGREAQAAPRGRAPWASRQPAVLNISQLERPTTTTTQPRRAPPGARPKEPQPLLAHEMIKGALVRYCESAPAAPPPATIVLLHGILGSRRNMQSYARRLVEGFPAWQVLLVDLRCHGESAPLSPLLEQPHSVEAAAADVLRLLSALKLFPEMLVGHSFGGKVVMSMAHQFGAAARRMPRPVRVWVLDALPGEVRSGEMGAADRPADLITTLQRTPLPLRTRAELMTRLDQAGFSPPVAAWAATNLTPLDGNAAELGWSFDLDGIAQMYRSYEQTDLWPLLAAPAEGISLAFVKAERSTFRWGGGDEERIRALGHAVHVLPRSGHWVHADNPGGLFDIMAPSFGSEPDMHMRHSPPRARL